MLYKWECYTNKQIHLKKKVKNKVICPGETKLELWRVTAVTRLADKSDIGGEFVFFFLFSNSDYIFLKNDSLEIPLTTPSLFVTHIDVPALGLLCCGKSLCKSITHNWRAVISHEFSNFSYFSL